MQGGPQRVFPDCTDRKQKAHAVAACQVATRAILEAIIPSVVAVVGELLRIGQFEYILLGVASALYGVTMIGYCRVQ